MSTTATRAYLPFARPSITDAERAAVLEVLDSGWLTTGAKSKAFESEFAAFVGARHAVALNSATAALHLALEALGVGPGDEVIVPTWTFAASAEVVFYLGAKPILIDIDRATLNLTVDGVLAAVTPRTKAVIPVHLGGRPVAIEALVAALTPLASPSSRTRRTRSRVASEPAAGWRDDRAGRRVLVLRDQDHHDWRGRDARHG